MPARQKVYDDALRIAPWVEGIDNMCLRSMVMEALVSRHLASSAGANVAAGDATLDQIRYGRYTGDVACQKASVALRHYDEAHMAVQHSATKKYGRALGRRYGKTRRRRKKVA